MSNVQLLKETKSYTTQDGIERFATNFYLQIGDARIPIEVKYFKGKDGEPDKLYTGRKEVMKAFATPIVKEPVSVDEE